MADFRTGMELLHTVVRQVQPPLTAAERAMIAALVESMTPLLEAEEDGTRTIRP